MNKFDQKITNFNREEFLLNLMINKIVIITNKQHISLNNYLREPGMYASYYQLFIILYI